jgi:hypothetical protein
MSKQMIMIACFRSESCESQLLIGEGFTIIEAIVRAVEYSMTEDQIFKVVQDYGPHDYDGLFEWYISRGIYLSEPLVLSDRTPIKSKKS